MKKSAGVCVDCTQICSSKQVFGDMETSVEFSMASEKIALGHREIHNLASTPKELQWTTVKAQRQNCELECENVGECDWSEQATLDGGGPVVETVAQNRTSMVRKMQHEPGVSHQREHSAVLGMWQEWTLHKSVRRH